MKAFTTEKGVIIEPVKVKVDVRGVVFEPVPPDVINNQRNVHLVLTAPGCVRGNHYHRYGTEIVVVFGQALVRFQENGLRRDIEVRPGHALRFTFPPGVAHAFKNTGANLMLLACFNTVKYDPAQPDIVPVQLLD